MVLQGSLFIVSAPSGAGKTSLVNALAKTMPEVRLSISCTTRKMRPNEQEGVDYYFVSKEEFKAKLKQKIFLEHAEVFGEFYGTSREWVGENRAKGHDVILEIDWQGARQIREQCLEAHSIFILPPTREALLERLQKRHPNNEPIIQERMNEAKEQIVRYNEYDYLICNDRFEDALQDLKSIIQSHRLNWRRQQIEKAELIKKLLS